MADLEALLNAVYERPEDDAPRSVYADALQSLGDPRGEFISLQLAKVSNPRTHELATRFAAAWLGELASVVIASEWKRGFPDRVVVDTFKSPLITRLARHREWTTIRMVELGGLVTWQQRNTIHKHQEVVARVLLKAPGGGGRRFQPSLAEIEAGVSGDR